MSIFEIIKDQVRDVKKKLFVTGAWISHESGIPRFRGKKDYGEIMMQWNWLQ